MVHNVVMRLWLCGFLLLVLSACAGADSDAQGAAQSTTTEDTADSTLSTSAPETDGLTEVSPQGEFDELFADLAVVDLSLTRDDVICDAFELGEDAVTEIVVGHYVVDGNLGAVCFGEEDPTTIEAFEELAVIVPSLQLTDLVLFAGFQSIGDEDEVTLAYVTTMSQDDTQFVLAVGIDSFNEDLNIARLTNAHELAHVITQTEFELDRSVFEDECETYYNGLGCFEEDSLLWSWMTEFWDPTVLATINGAAEVFVADGDQRCSIDDSYFGAYAASNPEEDFAEAFSAYVYGLDPDTPGQAAKLDWLASQPGLAEFRARADAAALTPLDNSFETCG